MNPYREAPPRDGILVRAVPWQERVELWWNGISVPGVLVVQHWIPTGPPRRPLVRLAVDARPLSDEDRAVLDRALEEMEEAGFLYHVERSR